MMGQLEGDARRALCTAVILDRSWKIDISGNLRLVKFAAFCARPSPSRRRKNNNIPGDGLNIFAIGASATMS
jgi:hypothetical protein